MARLNGTVVSDLYVRLARLCAHVSPRRQWTGDMLRTAAAGLASLYLMTALFAQAEERWFLMSRQGDCAEVGVLKRKIPDLGELGDPHAFVRFMRRKGYEVTSTRVPVPQGRAQEVNVPQRDLFLIFVTAEMCRGAEMR